MNIAAIGAHPDDIELNCFGTLLKHKQKGDNIILIYASDGATKNYNNEIIRNKQDSIKEAETSAEILGAKLYILNHKALDIPYNHEIVSQIEKILNIHNIDTVYTHWHGHTNQDHWRVSMSTLAAARCIKNVFMWEEGLPHSQCTEGFYAQYYNDITDHIEKKIECIKAHKTQIKKYSNDLIEAVKSRASYRGYQIRKKYAEAFQIKKITNL